MSSHDFTVDRVDDAIALVIEGAKDRGQTTSYSRVFAAGQMPAPQELHHGSESQLVTDFMRAFHDRCLERGLPPLDSLVVHVAGPRQNWPGFGYFKVNGLPDGRGERVREEDMIKATRFWEAQKAECKAWGTSERRRWTLTSIRISPRRVEPLASCVSPISRVAACRTPTGLIRAANGAGAGAGAQIVAL